MRERVFGDEAARRRLEAILHPAIRAEMERQSRAAGGPYQVLVIPLLIEGGRRDHIDRVLVVDVPEALADRAPHAGATACHASRRRRRSGPRQVVTRVSLLRTT